MRFAQAFSAIVAPTKVGNTSSAERRLNLRISEMTSSRRPANDAKQSSAFGGLNND